MMQYVVAYIGAAVVFFAIDMVWLSYVAKGFYASRLGDLLLDQPNIKAAAVFYLMYLVGVIIFAVSPAMKSESVAPALMFGALFGFFAYATYDFTNYATLKNWSGEVVVVDVAWGTVLTAVSAAAGYWAQKLIAVSA